MTAYAPNRPDDPIVRLRLFGALEALSVSGESVMPRGRKAQAILSYLALSPDGPVPRSRLVDLLWSTRWGEQGRGSLRQSLRELRAALGELQDHLITSDKTYVALDRSKVWVDGLSRRVDEPSPASSAVEPERLLETLRGLDPRFDAWIDAVRDELAVSLPVRVAIQRPAGETADRSIVPGAASAGGGLVLSVASLIQIGPGALDDFTAPALTQEVVTALARLRWIQVRFSHSPQQCDADYRLEGYISRVGDGCRVVMRLIDQADRGVIVWTGSVLAAYPLPAHAIAEVVERVVEQLDPEILAIETRKALRRGPTSDDSYQLVLRAMTLLYRFECDAGAEAMALLQRAAELDPQHGRAFAFLALSRVTALAHGWSQDVDGDLLRLDRDVGLALACDPRDSLALALGAHIRSFLHHDFQGALALFERAIRANPSCGFAWGYSSLTFAYLGRTEEAARRLARAQEIMIHDPYSSFMEAFSGVIAFFAGDWERTIEASRRQLVQRPAFTNVRKLLIGALCFTDRFEEARAEHARLLADEPGFAWSRHLETYPFGRTQDRVALEAVLHRAGLLPEAGAAGRRAGGSLRLVAGSPARR